VQDVHSHPQGFKTLRKDLVQGVHKPEIRLSVEETLQGIEESEEKNVGRARGNSLREILRILSYRNPWSARSAWEVEVSTRPSSGELAPRHLAGTH
jgi:hypothetical protein